MTFLETGQPILDVSQVVKLEKLLEQDGVSLATLMERAGLSVSSTILKESSSLRNCLVFCGSGNNGGDGWVIARDLARHSVSTTLFSPLEASNIQAEPARTKALEATALIEAASPHLKIVINPKRDNVKERLSSAEVVVDAMLGTGFSGTSLRDPYRLWIEEINRWKQQGVSRRIYAVDVPSGLSAQTGAAADMCINADITITMLANKPGLLARSGLTHCGNILLARIAEIDAFLSRL